MKKLICVKLIQVRLIVLSLQLEACNVCNFCCMNIHYLGRYLPITLSRGFAVVILFCPSIVSLKSYTDLLCSV